MNQKSHVTKPVGLASRLVASILVLALLLAAIVGIVYERSLYSTSTTESDTFITSCHITGQGGLEIRVISDTTLGPVDGARIYGVLTGACGGETEVIHVHNFTSQQTGWLTPVLPAGAQSYGTYSFNVQYGGKTYSFAAAIRPASDSCVTLRVPSGNVTTLFEYLQSNCPS